MPKNFLANIPLLTAYKLRSLVPYLSPTDATTVEEFSNSELAADYYVETVNMTCCKYENKNHLFDEFASFCGYDDSVYLQLDMLNHVAENTSCYEWDAHLLLPMNRSNLARCSAKIVP